MGMRPIPVTLSLQGCMESGGRGGAAQGRLDPTFLPSASLHWGGGGPGTAPDLHLHLGHVARGSLPGGKGRRAPGCPLVAPWRAPGPLTSGELKR